MGSKDSKTGQKEMKLVVDTNVLFGFFWENSVTRRFIVNSSLELISPVVALDEIRKYKDDLMKKRKITDEKFRFFLNDIKHYIKFIRREEYLDNIEEAEEISPDKKDSDFFALCLKFSCCLWSNDNPLKNQDRIRVLSVNDVLDLIL